MRGQNCLQYPRPGALSCGSVVSGAPTSIWWLTHQNPVRRPTAISMEQADQAQHHKKSFLLSRRKKIAAALLTSPLPTWCYSLRETPSEQCLYTYERSMFRCVDVCKRRRNLWSRGGGMRQWEKRLRTAPAPLIASQSLPLCEQPFTAPQSPSFPFFSPSPTDYFPPLASYPPSSPPAPSSVYQKFTLLDFTNPFRRPQRKCCKDVQLAAPLIRSTHRPFSSRNDVQIAENKSWETGSSVREFLFSR